MEWESVREYFVQHSGWLREALIFGGIGFLAGFFFRVFGRPLVYVILGGTVAVVLLKTLGVVTIHQGVLMRMLGFSYSTNFSTLVNIVKSWAWEHIVGLVAGTITFLFGWKMGA